MVITRDLRAYVWFKAKAVPGYDPSYFRKDTYGNMMAWTDYDKEQSDYGWKISHVSKTEPVIDKTSVLRPFHFKSKH